jgi:hypothetical protein
MADSTEERDVAVLLHRLLEPWESATWDELDRLEAADARDEEMVAPSGRRYRVKLFGGWDMEPWESDFYVWARVYGRGGWRRIFPYVDIVIHGGEKLPPDPPATTRWIKNERGKWRVRSDGSD